MKPTKNFSMPVLLGLGLIAVLLSAGVAYARPAFQGEFSLPYEVYWGKAVLSPGDYLLSVDFSTVPMIATIRSKDGKRVAVVTSGLADNDAKGESALLIVTKGRQSTVHSLRMTEAGLVLIFEPKLAREEAIREARQNQSVPVIVVSSAGQSPALKHRNRGARTASQTKPTKRAPIIYGACPEYCLG